MHRSNDSDSDCRQVNFNLCVRIRLLLLLLGHDVADDLFEFGLGGHSLVPAVDVSEGLHELGIKARFHAFREGDGE